MLRVFLFFIIFIPFCGISQNLCKVNKITLTGNNKTVSKLILNECEFLQLDSLKCYEIEDLVERSKNNLLNTSLFNTVDIIWTISESIVDFEIIVSERWYYWLYPIFEQADRNLSSFFYYRNWHKLNYGLAFDWQNFRGRNEILKFKFRLGYKQHYSLYYLLNQFGHQSQHGLWLGSDFFRQKQVISEIINNKANYFSADKDVYNNFRIESGYSLKFKIYSKFKARLIYENFYFDNHLSEIYDGYLELNNGKSLISPEAKFEYDKRDNINYPLVGNFVLFRMKYVGLLKNYYNHLQSDFKFQSNYKLCGSRLFASTHLNMFFIQDFSSQTNFPLYFAEQYFAENLIRGYEYFYLFSKEYYSIQQSFSFVLSKYREHNISFIRYEKFNKPFTRIYLKTFIDVAYSGPYLYEGNNNDMNDKILWSTGAGIAFETYYDRVLELRIAYNGFNQNFGIFADYKKTILKAF